MQPARLHLVAFGGELGEGSGGIAHHAPMEGFVTPPDGGGIEPVVGEGPQVDGPVDADGAEDRRAGCGGTGDPMEFRAQVGHPGGGGL